VEGLTLSHARWLLLPPTILLVWTLLQSFGCFVVLAAERGEPVRLEARGVALWVREGMARFLCWMVWPLSWLERPPRRAREPDAERTPLLLLPDYRMPSTTLSFLRTFLVRRGWSWVWPIGWSSSELSIAELAADLEVAVVRLQQASGHRQVDIVAHGLGGLVAAWYLRHHDGASSVHRLVTFGTPWSGTRMAVFGRGRICRELGYQASLLDELTPPPVPTVSVWSPDDPLVVPSSSAVPPGVESVRVDGAGHVEMLVSARVFRAVGAALSHPISQAAC